MPLYRVQLKQGKRTIVEQVEAKSLSNLLAFYKAATTMQVCEVLRYEYVDDTMVPPDDFNYNSLFKALAYNDTLGISRQFIFHNLKKSLNETEIFDLMKANLEVGNAQIDSIFNSLFKV